MSLGAADTSVCATSGLAGQAGLISISPSAEFAGVTSGVLSIPLKTAEIAVFAPIPSTSVRIAGPATPGLRASVHKVWRLSKSTLFIRRRTPKARRKKLSAVSYQLSARDRKARIPARYPHEF